MLKEKQSRLLANRFGPLVVLAALLLGLSLLTRIALLVLAHANMDWSPLNLLRVFGVGLFFDLVALSYFMIPLVVYLWLMPDRWYRHRIQTWWLQLSFVGLVFLLLFTAAGEWVFWGEFGSRFNFIAVDYLLYTQEVVRNIQESYPVGAILSGLLLVALVLIWLCRPALRPSWQQASRWQARTGVAALLLLLPVLSYWLVDYKQKDLSSNTVVNQLSGNGIYEFFAANRNNELDYATFYASEPDEKVLRRLRTLLKTPESTFISEDPRQLARTVRYPGPEKRMNVVLISVESLSADFMASFGNTQGITPQLDALAKQSLMYTNLYASGTRTVRGLEALSLALPPTPGQSIVRRPDNENLFSLGYVFRSKGYDSQFLYGGYGYFDNMNHFFGSNSYRVVDRTALSDKDVHFENVWGVADEDLFTLALRQMDQSVAGGKPFFSHIMTTSNHRPFTYPAGRIDIPPDSKSREGGVKYTDWAIGDFIRRAQKKPWFDNTLFVITADHCASSAGKTDLPVDRYHIPLMVYAPKVIQPGVMPRLMAQVDLAPTLLGLLNFSYTSHFFGYDIATLEPGRERIFIATYQDIGYLKDGKLAILSPRKQVKTVLPNFSDGSAVGLPDDPALRDDAIAWYQGASYLFRNKTSRLPPLP
ncbi:LTA synthase family protein [Leeia aquatica]|uniref:Sulfatase-like hydrolase/transferase n=1 Tax=Leeia aquatica TaxID=2725557 RepID=A0A847SFL2_9NEIS|nr:LTA synthase family protein [Leeia aquatica]NLR74742.1 sulfatase-like hydrolase/transferase [Leeia aquatica]